MNIKDIKNLSIAPFDYDLPNEKIAKYPVEPRDSSKLLVFRGNQIADCIYTDLANQLPEGSLLIMNDTKVVEARLNFVKNTGAQIEIFCLEPDNRYPDIQVAMTQQNEVYWLCLVGNAKRWKDGDLTLSYQFNGCEYQLVAQLIERSSDSFLVHFKWNSPFTTFAEILHLVGNIPLPPYIQRATEESDKEQYQTIYAREDGSVAAPTAGLHFTDRIFNSLKSKGIAHQFLTLHVGAGTFKPVKSETLGEHEMHAEFIDVSKQLLIRLMDSKNQIFVVGTTSLRTLETLYWMGVKSIEFPNKNLLELEINQWDAYELAQDVSFENAFTALIQKCDQEKCERIICKTSLLIAPGYRIRTSQGILTNFHQPQSTLLLLIYAFVGEKWKEIYRHALENDYRFLSFGDGSLLFKM